MDVEAASDILVVIIIAAATYYSTRSARRWWVHPINQSRKEQGDNENLFLKLKDDPEKFFKYTRMSVELFEELLTKVEPFLNKNSNRPSILPEARLALTLSFLASGDSLQSIALSYRMGASTVCNIVKETCDVLWECLQPILLPPPNQEVWEEVEISFHEKWDLPNCIGAMDGKHIMIQAPHNSGTEYFNYKKTFSIILFGVCDGNYIFKYVDIGSFGSQSDGGVFRASSLGQRLENNSLDLPEDKALPNTVKEVPHFFVGDEAFPLKINLMRPYSGRYLEESKQVFNYRLSRARRCIENAFGILSSRWRIFHKTIQAYPETAEKYVRAAVCLHNYIMINGQTLYFTRNLVDQEDHNKNVVPGEWRNFDPNGGLQSLQTIRRRLGARNARFNAVQFREYLKDYLNNEGAVPWQVDHITRK